MWIRCVQYLYPAYYYILSVALLLVHHETETLKSSSMCLNVSALRWLWITLILQFCVAIHWSEKVLSQTASKSTLILPPAGGEVCCSVAVYWKGYIFNLFSVKKNWKVTWELVTMHASVMWHFEMHENWNTHSQKNEKYRKLLPGTLVNQTCLSWHRHLSGSHLLWAQWQILKNRTFIIYIDVEPLVSMTIQTVRIFKI